MRSPTNSVSSGSQGSEMEPLEINSTMSEDYEGEDDASRETSSSLERIKTSDRKQKRGGAFNLLRRIRPRDKSAASIAIREEEEDNDEESGQSAADALARDLEDMGYNLSCDTFFTKDSDQDHSAERYTMNAGGRGSDKQKKKKKKKPIFENEIYPLGAHSGDTDDSHSYRVDERAEKKAYETDATHGNTNTSNTDSTPEIRENMSSSTNTSAKLSAGYQGRSPGTIFTDDFSTDSQEWPSPRSSSPQKNTRRSPRRRKEHKIEIIKVGRQRSKPGKLEKSRSKSDSPSHKKSRSKSRSKSGRREGSKSKRADRVEKSTSPKKGSRGQKDRRSNRKPPLPPPTRVDLEFNESLLETDIGPVSVVIEGMSVVGNAREDAAKYNSQPRNNERNGRAKGKASPKLQTFEPTSEKGAPETEPLQDDKREKGFLWGMLRTFPTLPGQNEVQETSLEESLPQSTIKEDDHNSILANSFQRYEKGIELTNAGFAPHNMLGSPRHSAGKLETIQSPTTPDTRHRNKDGSVEHSPRENEQKRSSWLRSKVRKHDNGEDKKKRIANILRFPRNKDKKPEIDASKDRKPEKDANKEQKPGVDAGREPVLVAEKETVRERDASKEPVQKNDASKDTVRGRETSRDIVGRRDASKESVRQRDKSRESARQRDKSRESARQRDKSKDSAQQRDKGKDSARQRDKSKDSAQQRDKSKDSARQRESKDSARQRDKSKDSARQRDTSRESLQRRDASNERKNKATGQAKQDQEASPPENTKKQATKEKSSNRKQQQTTQRGRSRNRRDGETTGKVQTEERDQDQWSLREETVPDLDEQHTFQTLNEQYTLPSYANATLPSYAIDCIEVQEMKESEQSPCSILDNSSPLKTLRNRFTFNKKQAEENTAPKVTVVVERSRARTRRRSKSASKRKLTKNSEDPPIPKVALNEPLTKEQNAANKPGIEAHIAASKPTSKTPAYKPASKEHIEVYKPAPKEHMVASKPTSKEIIEANDKAASKEHIEVKKPASKDHIVTNEFASKEDIVAKKDGSKEQNTAKKPASKEQNTAKKPVPKEQNTAKKPVPKEQNTAKKHVPKEQNTAKKHVPKEQNTAKKHVPKEQNTAKKHVPKEQNTAKKHVPKEQNTAKKPASKTAERQKKAKASKKTEATKSAASPLKRALSPVRRNNFGLLGLFGQQKSDFFGMSAQDIVQDISYDSVHVKTSVAGQTRAERPTRPALPSLTVEDSRYHTVQFIGDREDQIEVAVEKLPETPSTILKSLAQRLDDATKSPRTQEFTKSPRIQEFFKKSPPRTQQFFPESSFAEKEADSRTADSSESSMLPRPVNRNAKVGAEQEGKKSPRTPLCAKQSQTTTEKGDSDIPSSVIQSNSPRTGRVSPLTVAGESRGLVRQHSAKSTTQRTMDLMYSFVNPIEHMQDDDTIPTTSDRYMAGCGNALIIKPRITKRHRLLNDVAAARDDESTNSDSFTGPSEDDDTWAESRREASMDMDMTDEGTNSDIQSALNTLKRHAARLGVSETELLNHTDHPHSIQFDSDARSEVTTLGEELMEFMNLYITPLMRNPLMSNALTRRRSPR